MKRGDGERNAPSGWYADPDNADATRWWDGRQWTAVVRPSNPPTDLRGKRLLLAGCILVTAGTVASWIAFPWLASEPEAGHNDPNPTWVTILSFAAPIAVVLGIACFISRWVVRRRPND